MLLRRSIILGGVLFFAVLLAVAVISDVWNGYEVTYQVLVALVSATIILVRLTEGIFSAGDARDREDAENN
jgi:hypothetical protein